LYHCLVSVQEEKKEEQPITRPSGGLVESPQPLVKCSNLPTNNMRQNAQPGA
jgi:hypothetical protein